MRAILVSAAVVLSAGTSLSAQTNKTANASNPAVSTARMLWEQPTEYITTVAEELPESTYAYRPTPEVRSFGQLIGHVAGAQYLFCAAALGEPERQEDDIEKTRTRKADLVAALKASTQYCAKAYAQSDRNAQQTTKLFGQQRTRLYALGLNANHNAEHYGNLVTYLRINGIVPPSSRR
ncbi:MAG TPA: DinB family protein [Gemmatimonadales bacterium]|nr:DinB family protein [Gemmatimonadales bacterium]